jgi:DNA (cytosine-5)-methyltransferase 1
MGNKYKFIDLCAGIGGFHLALHKLGLECVFASEIEESARKSYEINFKNKSPKLFSKNRFNKNIFELKTKDIPRFDILCAGFPCQPFSQIGYKKGFKENLEGRGNLFFEIERILKDKRPRAFLLENVQHILKHDNNRTFSTIQQRIIDLKYSFYFQVIRASDFNLPQLRPRTFMVGFSDEKRHDPPFEFPQPIKLKKTMSDVFGGKCNREIGFTLRLGGAGSGINDRRNWDRYLVDGKEVLISPENGKAMQGFPKSHFLADSRTKSMKLLGNSVAVNVVKAIGKQMLKYMNNRKSFEKKGDQSKLPFKAI